MQTWRLSEPPAGVMVSSYTVTVVLRGGCIPAHRRAHRKRVKRETYNKPMDFLSDPP
jgi:hypothetical protein